MKGNKQLETIGATQTSSSLAGEDEAGPLAVELAKAYRQQVQWYRDQMRMDDVEADTRARGTDYSPQEVTEDLQRIQDQPPDQVSWFDLERLVERDPDAMVAVWQDIKQQAREELRSGHRAAKAVAWGGSPWQRARFLAIRSSFREEHPPQSGIEVALVDMAAADFSAWLELSEQYQMLTSTEGELERGSLERTGRWTPPHELIAEHTERAERMVEAAHQRVLKTVRMLIEVRRSAQTLYVAHAGQVNVGQNQVNLTERRAATSAAPQDLPKSSGT